MYICCIAFAVHCVSMSINDSLLIHMISGSVVFDKRDYLLFFQDSNHGNCYPCCSILSSVKYLLHSWFCSWKGAVSLQYWLLSDHFSWICHTKQEILWKKGEQNDVYIEDITWLRGDTKFPFECWKYIRVKYFFQHEKRNFVSPSDHVMFYFLYKHQLNTKPFYLNSFLVWKVRFIMKLATVIFSHGR